MRACRTCITKYDLCPLFSELKFSSEQLFIATGVKIQPNDGLPQTVCKSCMKAITKSLHLREISSKAEEFLKTIAKHNVIKIERDDTIIDDTKKLTHNFSKTNSYFCNKEQNRIDESNVDYDDIKPMVKYGRNGISITVKNYNAENYEQLHETEFVDVKTEHEYSEYERNKNTIVKNCITLPNGAEIILYPTKVSERKSNNTAAESFKYSHVDSTVDFCESLEINQQALTNQIIATKESTNHCMIKCKNRVNDCQSETYQTNKHVSGHYVSQNLDKISPQTVTVLAKTTKTSDRLSDIRFEDFNSSKELEELFKDTLKFGKNMDVPDEKPSQSGQKIANTQNVITKQKNCTSNEKSHRNLRNCEVKLVKKQFPAVKVTQEDLNIRKEDQGHENLFANLMSALKDNLAKLVPNDTQETNVIRKKYNNIQPTKMDLSRRKYFQERNKNLMSLAVTPYTDCAIQCSVCSDVTRNKHSFRSHALKHFEKQHICQYAGCGKKFVHRSQLTRHVQCMHGVEKRFSCTQCGFRAADRPAMMNHIRAEHTGEKPFECNECGAKFRMRNNIIQHIKQVHNKPNKYLQCEFCSLRFQYRRDLWMHQDKAHFYTYNYYCYLCTNIYRSGCSTRKHLLKVHGVPKDQQLKLRRDKIRKPDAPKSSNVKPVVSNIPR